MLTRDEMKAKVGRYAAGLIHPGMRVGIGSGSTVAYFIEELSKRVGGGLAITGVPTSSATEHRCRALGISMVDIDSVDHLDLTVDGADEIDGEWRLIKGGGAALLQEKIVASNSKKLIIIADESKMVDTLGQFPLPVEVVPFGWQHTMRRISETTGCSKIDLRLLQGAPLVTDHQHYLLDCYFGSIADPAHLDRSLQNIPGVVETGLFLGLTSSIIIGYNDGRVVQKDRQAS